MYPIYHFILTVIMSGFLYPILGWKILLFWLGSFFVDVDHYLWYILKFKDLSLKDAIKYGKDLNFNDFKLHIFHIIEFWILIVIWSVYSELAFVILLGLVFHNVIDLIYIIDTVRYDKRALSFFEWIYKKDF